MNISTMPLLEKQKGNLAIFVHEEVQEADLGFKNIFEESYLVKRNFVMAQSIVHVKRELENFCTDMPIVPSFIDFEFRINENVKERRWYYTLLPESGELVTIPDPYGENYPFNRWEAGILVATLFDWWNVYYGDQAEVIADPKKHQKEFTKRSNVLARCKEIIDGAYSVMD